MEVINQNVLNWNTRQLMLDALVSHFKECGYRVCLCEAFFADNTLVIFATRAGKKKIIQVKGYLEPRPASMTDAFKVNDVSESIAQELEGSLLTLSKSYSNQVLPVAIGLPGLPRYRKVVERMSPVFTAANLSLNIYFVEANGQISRYNLNRN